MHVGLVVVVVVVVLVVVVVVAAAAVVVVRFGLDVAVHLPLARTVCKYRI